MAARLLTDLPVPRFFVPAIKYFLTIIFLLNAIHVAAQAIFTVPERDDDGIFTVSWTKVNAFGALHEVVNGNLVKLTDFGATSGSFEVRGKQPGAYTYRLTEGRSGSQQIEPIYTTKTIVVGAATPSISGVANRTIPEDSPTGAIPFTVADADTPANTLRVTVLSSSNPALIPVSNVVLTPVPWGDAGNNRTLNVTPAANAYGSSVITLQVMDEGNRAAVTSFTVTVTAVNDPPSITPISNISINEGVAASGPIAFSISDPDATAPLTVSVASSNPAVAPPNGITRGGSGNQQTITLTAGTSPYREVVGSSEITVTVSDGVASANRKFTFTINNRLATLYISTEANKPEVINLQWDLADVSVRIKESFEGGAETEPADLGALPRVGSKQILRPRSGVYTYNIYDCTYSGGPNGTYTDCSRLGDSKSVRVTMPAPSVTASITPSEINEAGSAELTWSSTNASNCSATNISGVNGLSGTAQFNAPSVMSANQVVDIVVTCTGSGGSGSKTVPIRINWLNDSPVITTPSSTVAATEDTAFTIPFTVSDEETAAANLIVTAVSSDASKIASISVDRSNNRLNITPVANANGNVSVTLRVADAQGLYQEKTVAVVIGAVDDLPVISEISNQTLSETNSTDVSFTVSDIDSPIGIVSVSTSSSVVVVPALTGSGPYVLKLTAPRMTNSIASHQATITVSVANSPASVTRSFIATVTNLSPELWIEPTGTTGVYDVRWDYGSQAVRLLENGVDLGTSLPPSGTTRITKANDGTFRYSLRDCDGPQSGLVCAGEHSPKDITVRFPAGPSSANSSSAVSISSSSISSSVALTSSSRLSASSSSAAPIDLVKTGTDLLQALNISVSVDPLNDAMPEPEFLDALTGMQSVGSDGSFNYSLPLSIPVGINGTQPKLQLNYNSNSKNGLVGWGWALNGLSVISRCNANMIRDGYVSGIQANDNYKYCIDGQRLVEVTSGEYRTESESFSRIKKLGDYWEVTSNNGTQSRYGFNSDSKLEDDQSQTYAWHLDQQKDVSNNSWSVTYNKFSLGGTNTHYPASISYTNSPLLGALHSIIFHYEDREDISVKYVAGVRVKSDKRLARIEVKSGSATVHSYVLAYQELGQTYHGKPYSDPAKTSRLASIKQCFSGSSVDCAEPVRFDWSIQHVSNYMFKKVPYVKPTESGTSTPTLPTDNASEGSSSFMAHRILGLEIGSGIIINDPPKLTAYNFDYVDMNGDGLLDKVRYPNADCFGTIFWCRYDNVPGYPSVPQDISVAINTGGSLSEYQVWYDQWGCVNAQRGCGRFSQKLVFVDLNGDGLRDLFAFSAYPFTSALRTHMIGYNNGKGIDGGAFTSVQDPGSSWSNTALNGDFNGDGIIDIANMEIYSDKITVQMGEGKIRASNGDIKSFLPRVDALVGNYFLNDCGKTPPEKPKCIRAVKDFNNDGLDDILEWTGSSDAQVYISLGGSAQGSIRFAAPIQFFNSELFQSIASDNQPGNFLLANQLVDWNRDGFYEFLHNSSSGNHLSDAKNSLVVNRIEKVLEASRSITPTYEPLSSNLEYEYLPTPSASEEANQLVVPEVMKGNRFGVKEVQVSNGIGGTNKTAYKYIGAKTHSAGYGDLGFATVEKLEIAAGQTPLLTIRNYYQTATNKYKLAGKLKRELIYTSDVNGSQGTLLADSRYQWKVRIYNDDLDANYKSPHYFSYLYQISNLTRDLEGRTIADSLTQNRPDATQSCDRISSAPSIVTVNAGTANDSDYTADGALVYSQTATCDESGSSASVQIKAVENLDITSKGDARGLVQKSKQYAWTGNAISSAAKSFYDVRTQSFTYNALGQLESKTIEPEAATPNSLKLTTNYLYNGFGSVRQITDSWDDSANDGLDVNTRVTTIDETYTNGIRKLVVTKPQNISETTEFHPWWGTPTKQIDANGLETNTLYDNQGRPERINYADGTSSQIDYRNCSGCSPYHSNAVWYKQIKTTGSSAVRMYYDGFNREIGSRSKGLTGREVYTVQTYDSRGAPFQTTAPFYYGEAQKTVATYYDALGRVSSVTHPDGSSESRGYYGLRHTTTNRLNQTQTRYLNAAGWVMKSVDNANTPVDFTYWPWGDLKTTQVNNDPKTLVSVVYDKLGRKTEMTDPNTGKTTYTYNALDLIATQTDAKNQRTCFGYDALGRQTKRVDNASSSCSGTTQNWVYDTQTKGKGQLGSMSGVNTDGTSYSEQYSYNNYGLPESTTSSFDGSSYTTKQHYDSYNRPLGVTYPTGYVAANSYNSYGHLDQVKDSTGATLWAANDADALGSLKQFTLGNGVVTTQTYDADTSRIESIRAVSGSLVIQDQRYQFDDLGNLRSREDRKNSITQSFCYDGLNRLKAARFNGCSSAVNDYNYDPLGNLTTKEGLTGTLGYGTNGGNVAGPHAVTSANGWAYQYDEIGNLKTATKAGEQTRTVSYSPFNTPTSITQGSKFSTLVYGPNQDRIKHSDSNGRETKYVGGIYEEVTKGDVTQKIHYVGDFALLISQGENTNATYAHEYMHRDHIGSIVAISKGKVETIADVSWQANGAWGERRFNQWNGPLDNLLIPTSTAKGFTDHEHLDAVGLIHMNGRVYDPELGRFMSADPFVQAPYNSQSYNRYSYVFNNPLSFTDPSGYTCGQITEYFRATDDETGRHLGTWSQTREGQSSGGTLCGQDALDFQQDQKNLQDRDWSQGSLWERINPFSEYNARQHAVEMGWVSNVNAPHSGKYYFSEEELAIMSHLGAGGGAAPGKLTIPSVNSVAGTKYVVPKLNPKLLIGRQGKNEMEPAKIKKMTKDMKENGYGQKYPPIDAAFVDGKLIILDGHHRAAAASRAGITEVPVNIYTVSKEVGDQLIHEVAESLSRY